MEQIHLAFLWHQHQPYYKDPVGGEYRLPWVRLHAIKDYVGMLLVLKEFPAIHATINLVPSLVVQIEEYARDQAEDRNLRLTRIPAEDLIEADRLYILDQFFMANAPKLIDPFPRYRELFHLRKPWSHKPAQVLREFSPQALRDVQVWATLAWFHPLVVEGDPALKALRAKGRDFTEQDKAAMLRSQEAVLRRLLPLHKEMADSGQIELSTTPFYHPILPLLCNPECAREGLPGLPMPDKRSDFLPDAHIHLERALAQHERTFHRPATGIWPAEGSVSMDILPLLRDRGLRWIATDEAILARSRPTDLSRDSSASLLHPDALYQPYSLPGDGDLPAIIFRDRVLADSIGFEYHRGDQRAGAENFVWRICEAARRCSGGPRLVSVILDGENPWDYYDDAGVPFLRDLYARLSKEPAIATTRLTDYVTAHPSEKSLSRLYAGSWIDANFGIWIGAPEDRAAWSLVAETRETLLTRLKRQPPLDPKSLEQAWEQLYVAEGSDWCWWLGGDHTSDQDYMFDELFRSHLANVYCLIGAPAPDSLSRPLGKPAQHLQRSDPLGTISPVVDGAVSEYQEWSSAGHVCATASSSMHRGLSDPFVELYFGVSSDAFFLRLDPSGSDIASLPKGIDITLQIRKPAPSQWRIGPMNAPEVRRDAGDLSSGPQPRAAAGRILEIAIPISLLAAKPGDVVEFDVQVRADEALIQRIPAEGSLPVLVAQ